MQDTRLKRTRVGGDPHTLVLRRSRDEPFPMHLLSGEELEDVLAVTYGDPSALLRAWCDRVGRRPRNAGVVSVGGRMRSATATSGTTAPSEPTTAGESTTTSTSTAPKAPHRNVVQGVADPANVSGVLDVALGYLDAWPRDGRSVAYFDSVTALLEHVNADAATDFLADLLRALSERDVVGYFCLTPSAHDCATVRAVTSLFDTVIECIDETVADSNATADPNTTANPSTTADPNTTADTG